MPTTTENRESYLTMGELDALFLDLPDLTWFNIGDEYRVPIFVSDPKRDDSRWVTFTCVALAPAGGTPHKLWAYQGLIICERATAGELERSIGSSRLSDHLLSTHEIIALRRQVRLLRDELCAKSTASQP